ncbi:MAG: sterol desaturase family protein [Actinomycetota bacterium]
METLAFIGLVLTLAGLLLFVADLWRHWRRGQLNRQLWKEMGANISTIPPLLIVGGLTTVMWAAVLGVVSTLTPLSIPTTPLTILLAVVAYDVNYYWMHRAEHRVAWLWALIHSVHHSSPVFNQTTAYRISFTDAIFTNAFFVPLAIIGFDPLLILAVGAFNLAYQGWIHTEVIGKLPRPIEYVFNTASHHRVHHGSDAKYLDTNYAGMFIIFDRIFGTFQVEEETPVYGLTVPLGTTNPIDAHFLEFRRLWAKVRTTEGVANRWRLMWGPPVGYYEGLEAPEASAPRPEPVAG